VIRLAESQIIVHGVSSKNLGGRVGVKKNFILGGRGHKFLNILLRICENPKKAETFSEKKNIFGPKKSKIFF
jgi:hypothetical protein